MLEPTVSDLQDIRRRVEQVARLSDGLVKIGGLRLGLDGVLAWLPGVGEVYSTAAGGYILYQGVRAGVPLAVLAKCGALLLGRTGITAVPLAGPLAADFFTAHRWSAKMVLKAIDQKLAAMGAPVQPMPGGFLRRMWSGKRPMASAV